MQSVRDEHVIVGMDNDVDDGVADPKHVVSCCGHCFSEVEEMMVLFAPRQWMRQAGELCRLSRLTFGRSPQSLVHPALPAWALRFEAFKHIPVDTKASRPLSWAFFAVRVDRDAS